MRACIAVNQNAIRQTYGEKTVWQTDGGIFRQVGQGAEPVQAARLPPEGMPASLQMWRQ